MNMDDSKKCRTDAEKEIVCSKTIKAGKRIYYIDVKKNRKEEMFLAITESKKVISNNNTDTQVNFEKHKIFLYKEDFDNFIEGLTEAIDFIKKRQECQPRESEIENQDLNFDITF